MRTLIDIMDKELLALLKKAGCKGIHYGIESGTEKILKVINKEIDQEKSYKMVQWTKEMPF